MNRLNYIVLISILMLSGCATTTTKDMQEVILDSKTKNQYVFPEESKLATCPELPELPKGKKILPADLVRLINESGKVYSDCANDKDELAAWINRFKAEVSKK